LTAVFFGCAFFATNVVAPLAHSTA
jgi:hypothetical protein